MKKIILAALALLSINAQAEGPELLLGYIFNQEGITLQVFSGGCTDKKDFGVEKGFRNYTTTLTFFRRHQDTCLAILRYGERIQYTYEELGIEPLERFKIMNPVDTSRRYF